MLSPTLDFLPVSKEVLNLSAQLQTYGSSESGVSQFRVVYSLTNLSPLPSTKQLRLFETKDKFHFLLRDPRRPDSLPLEQCSHDLYAQAIFLPKRKPGALNSYLSKRLFDHIANNMNQTFFSYGEVSSGKTTQLFGDKQAESPDIETGLLFHLAHTLFDSDLRNTRDFLFRCYEIEGASMVDLVSMRANQHQTSATSSQHLRQKCDSATPLSVPINSVSELRLRFRECQRHSDNWSEYSNSNIVLFRQRPNRGTFIVQLLIQPKSHIQLKEPISPVTITFIDLPGIGRSNVADYPPEIYSAVTKDLFSLSTCLSRLGTFCGNVLADVIPLQTYSLRSEVQNSLGFSKPSHWAPLSRKSELYGRKHTIFKPKMITNQKQRLIYRSAILCETPLNVQQASNQRRVKTRAGYHLKDIVQKEENDPLSLEAKRKLGAKRSVSSQDMTSKSYTKRSATSPRSYTNLDTESITTLEQDQEDYHYVPTTKLPKRRTFLNQTPQSKAKAAADANIAKELETMIWTRTIGEERTRRDLDSSTSGHRIASNHTTSSRPSRTVTSRYEADRTGQRSQSHTLFSSQRRSPSRTNQSTKKRYIPPKGKPEISLGIERIYKQLFGHEITDEERRGEDIWVYRKVSDELKRRTPSLSEHFAEGMKTFSLMQYAQEKSDEAFCEGLEKASANISAHMTEMYDLYELDDMKFTNPLIKRERAEKRRQDLENRRKEEQKMLEERKARKKSADGKSPKENQSLESARTPRILGPNQNAQRLHLQSGRFLKDWEEKKKEEEAFRDRTTEIQERKISLDEYIEGLNAQSEANETDEMVIEGDDSEEEELSPMEIAKRTRQLIQRQLGGTGELVEETESERGEGEREESEEKNGDEHSQSSLELSQTARSRQSSRSRRLIPSADGLILPAKPTKKKPLILGRNDRPSQTPFSVALAPPSSKVEPPISMAEKLQRRREKNRMDREMREQAIVLQTAEAQSAVINSPAAPSPELKKTDGEDPESMLSMTIGSPKS
ncbi:hypothetical protein BLNAU_1476 [Blattamonas nauphoetae]|uniref:Kinesin motor domain-containing protein n=1 Tax=Blattamonas nauphoetae TaxID=2049346 RepID=A0ABQ9YI58_9EUKA|nr:hypothetical protein BLNAU_1476 [Blattamonas nauphoetae]